MRESIPLRLIEGVDRLARLVTAPALPGMDEVLDQARRRTGLDDFGDDGFEEPLQRLLEACAREADLSLFGRLSLRWDLMRLLANRLILRDCERASPEILRRPVAAPIFIMGLPRSGTSFLHQLLAEDPQTLAPECWRTIFPCPSHPASGRSAGPDQVQRQFRLFQRIQPEIMDLHPFDAHTPQECTEITAHSFRSLRFETTYDIPSYRTWLAQVSHEPAYRLHRRFLQHLQGTAEGRWVLKSPDHVFAMDALRTVYPDARLVFVHRDPLKVLPSVARLTAVLRRPFARRVDPAGIGRQVTRDWARGAALMIAARSHSPWPSGQVQHIRHTDLVMRPIESVRRLYEGFGMALTPRVEQRLRALVARKPRGGYGDNVYRFTDHGLDPEIERHRYRAYMEAFDVEPEVHLPPKPAAAPQRRPRLEPIGPSGLPAE